MCLPVVAKWASAMQLRTGIADDLDTNQINHILNRAWQIVMKITHSTSPLNTAINWPFVWLHLTTGLPPLSVQGYYRNSV